MGENLKTDNQQKIPKLATTGRRTGKRKKDLSETEGGREERKQLEIQSDFFKTVSEDKYYEP